MERLTLNLVPAGVMPEAHASQFDNGRVIRFDIRNGEEAYTLTGAETITAEIAKPDGSREVISIPNTSSNYVDLTTEENTCSVPGLYGCEIKITDGAEIIGSQNFILKVEADPYADENVHVETVGPADICTFETTLPEPLQSVIVNVVATGGNGNPDSPIPVNGYTEANITANGDTVTIAFGQTVYGGLHDVTRGKLRVSFGDSNLSDLTGWTYANGFSRTLALASIIKKPTSQTVATNVLCSIYKSVSWNACGDNDFEFAFNANNGELIIKDSRYTDVPSFLAGVSGISFVYELATPFDIDLTPEVISAIVGTNNVFAGCGQTTVKYLKAGA